MVTDGARKEQLLYGYNYQYKKSLEENWARKSMHTNQGRLFSPFWKKEYGFRDFHKKNK